MRENLSLLSDFQNFQSTQKYEEPEQRNPFLIDLDSETRLQQFRVEQSHRRRRLDEHRSSQNRRIRIESDVRSRRLDPVFGSEELSQLAEGVRPDVRLRLSAQNVSVRYPTMFHRGEYFQKFNIFFNSIFPHKMILYLLYEK